MPFLGTEKYLPLYHGVVVRPPSSIPTLVMEVYREILPQSYLLILADDAPSHPNNDNALDWALRRAARSGKPSVWIDCSHITQLPAAAAGVLTQYYHKMHRHGTSLVLCHLNEELRNQLQQSSEVLHPPVVGTLIDAEQYCEKLHALQHASA